MVFDILNYIKKCPYFDDYTTNVDFLGKNPYSLSVGGVSKNEKVKEYTDGDSLLKSTFLLRVRLPYGIDMNKNLRNSGLINDISEWFLKNSERGILPEFSADKIPISFRVDFLKDDVIYSSDTAIFTADITVVYYKTKSL